MRSFSMRRAIFPVGATLLILTLIPLPASLGAEATWRSGHPPTIISAKIDDQRRLVVEFNAPDGMAHLNSTVKDPPPIGGSVVMDDDAVNATPAYESAYGPLMACNNKSNCRGRWSLPTYAESNTYIFTTEPLSEQKFPAGTYYLQVNVFNEDPYPSTRQEEFSKIATVVLGTVAPSHIVPLLLSAIVPISNGTPLCVAWRNYMAIGNLAARAQNVYNAAMNARLTKMSAFPPVVEAIYQRTLKETAAGKAALAKNSARANSACSPAPTVEIRNGGFIPVPVPASNGTAVCKRNRDHLVYLNQELLKVVNNFRTTKSSQTTRVGQLNTRFNQLVADLGKTWPLVFKTCAPF